MEYFKKSIDFLVKNFIFAIPLYAAIAVPLFFSGLVMNTLITQLPQILQNFMSGNVSNPMEMIQELMTTMQAVAGTSALGGFFGMVLGFIAYPMVTGLIKKSLAGEETGFEHFVDALKENFTQYLLFVVGCIVVGIIAGVGLLIVFIILGLILGLLGGVGTVLMVIIGLGALVFGIYFGVRLFSLWLPAMIIDKAGIMEGLKKGFAATEGSFWLIFLVTLLVGLASGILSGIFGFLSGIFFIGPVVLGAISTAASFILLIFCMIVYKDKTSGKIKEATTDTEL